MSNAGWKGLIREYRERLPTIPDDAIVTLLEGGTPLLEARSVSSLAHADVFLKIEGANPTGSFKDRGMTVAISKAVDEGAKAVICASTGNTCLGSGLRGAGRAEVRGRDPRGADRDGQARASAHPRCDSGADPRQLRCRARHRAPARRERQGRGGQLGEPVSHRRPEDRGLRGRRRARRGTERALHPGGQRRQHHRLLAGVPGGRGGWTLDPAAAHARVAGDGCPPLVRGEPVPHPETIATAIQIGNPASWDGAIGARDESGGTIGMVSDADILHAYRLLADREGVFCEPASAASVAGLLQAIDSDLIAEGSVALAQGRGGR